MSDLTDGPSARRQESEHLPALDGIRAFAVTAVILYHFGVAGVSGGLLGVDVFFVLSGFLITSLLCGEQLKRGTIHLGQFWARRARRLLPGLFLLLLGVAVYAWAFRNSVDVSTIRGDAIATLLYFANWHFILTSQGYFAQSTTPSPLLHMWSLGVEEQYYLIWPGVVLLILRKNRENLVAWVSAAGAAASALLMAMLYLAGYSIDRLYYGTDTRAQALLVGSFLGAIASQREWRVFAKGWARTQTGRVTGGLIGTVGVGVLLFSWNRLNGQDAFLYQGGFLLVALAAGAVISHVTSWRDSWLAKVLSLPPVTYLGRISYGLYLYHWPLFLAIDHAHTGLSGSTLLAVRLVSTLLIAILSFHLVEQPIRRGALARTWRGLVWGLASATSVCAILIASTIPPAFATLDVSKLPTGLTGTEHQALEEAHAFTTNPIRFLFVGDSLEVTMYLGLRVDSEARYGVDVIDGGDLGCDLSPYPSLLQGAVRNPPISTEHGLNCPHWRTDWQQEVTTYRPEVAGILIGRFELADHLYQGHWVHVGQPGWDSVLLNELDDLVDLLSSEGAHVVIFTFPYIDPPYEQANGDPYPENLPSRVDAWNRLLIEVAARDPGVTTVIGLNRILDPRGQFTETVDGVEVREPDDGIHISVAGGEWLQSFVLPEIDRLALGERPNG
jgi:peptidoglycan/LPS O-acetylase OafA/YrhL